MLTNSSSDRFIAPYVTDEFKALNAQIPRKRKSLADLLKEERPHIMCNDGNAHLFRKKELKLLSQMLSGDEEKSLLLPMIMEIKSEQPEITIRTRGGSEAKILSKILEMPVTERQNRITIYRPQLNVIRKTLKTTTQYVFSP